MAVAKNSEKTASAKNTPAKTNTIKKKVVTKAASKTSTSAVETVQIPADTPATVTIGGRTYKVVLQQKVAGRILSVGASKAPAAKKAAAVKASPAKEGYQVDQPGKTKKISS